MISYPCPICHADVAAQNMDKHLVWHDALNAFAGNVLRTGTANKEHITDNRHRLDVMDEEQSNE